MRVEVSAEQVDFMAVETDSVTMAGIGPGRGWA